MVVIKQGLWTIYCIIFLFSFKYVFKTTFYLSCESAIGIVYTANVLQFHILSQSTEFHTFPEENALALKIRIRSDSCSSKDILVHVSCGIVMIGEQTKRRT